jgi:2-keto-4-pentenoate hydratase/2-oxohepta-3-ene-1,7-dioic acid hydratase in catechol pathway
MSRKHCRFIHDGEPVWGLIDGDDITLIAGDLLGEHTLTSKKVTFSDVRLLAPVTPTKIICVGRNYLAHVKERTNSDDIPQEPVLFTKPLTSLIGPEDGIVYPPLSERVDYEGEIGVVIGSRCTHVSEVEAPGYIFGCTCVNDVTARDLQNKDLQWTRAKGFDTFCPVGPFLVTDLDYLNLNVTTRLNGEQKQSSNSVNMIFSIPWLVSYISQAITLMPGDLLATGTPAGIGPMQIGDIIEVEVEGVGILKNRVVKQ